MNAQLPNTDDDPRSSVPHHEADEDPHPPPASLTFELLDPHNLLTQCDRDQIINWTNSVLSHINNPGSIRAKLVDDEQMAAAHLQFSGIPGTTDVLTFDLAGEEPIESPIENKVLDTDLIICVDEAARQAQTQSHTTAHEILLYIIHGTLHCLGYNDHTQDDYNRMHTKEDQLLTQAGIGPLFNTDTNQSGGAHS